MSEEKYACPRCGTHRIVMGELTRGRTIGPVPKFSFRAFGSQLSWLRKGAELLPSFAACSNCGLVWSEVRVSRLHQQLERFPGEELQQWLRSPVDTPI